MPYCFSGGIFLETIQYHNIFDSHAHYNDKRFLEDQETLFPQIHESGVSAVVNIGCDLETSQEVIDLAEKYPWFYCSVGIHPHEAGETPENYLEKLRRLAQHSKVVAIGEIGLDYYYDLSPRELQKKIFEEQLLLAEELNLPVVIHAREATADYLEILKKHRPKGVVHCFSGSAETAKEVLNLGMYISFTGVLTFNNARKAIEAVKEIPLDRLLLETDCPYLAPVPYRGKRCDSRMIAKTAEKMAEIKGIPAQQMIDIANENTCRLFGITP